MLRRTFGALSLATVGAPAAYAQHDKVAKMLVGFPAGQATDIIARLLAEALKPELEETVIVDNKPGQGGSIALGLLARAAPDGSTFILSPLAALVINPHLYKNVAYQSLTSFEPVARVCDLPLVLVVHPSLPAKTLPELIAYAKANPDKLTAGFPGNGTLGHITGVLLQQRTGIRFAQAQYRGTQQILTDLLGGHIDLAMDSMAAYVPNVQEGKLRALALASSKRWPNLPDVPTVAEAGLPGFEASVWYALLAPAGTPQEVIGKLNAATNEFLKSPATQEMFAKLGIETVGGAPEALQAFMRSEVEKWAPIIKEAGITF
jgi:tripartite-type tricarboxylate transporter receptor subunit TctC